MSSIVMILLKIYQNIDFNKKYEVKQLIEKAINYILMQEIDHDKYGSFFPYNEHVAARVLGAGQLAILAVVDEELADSGTRHRGCRASCSP